MWTSRSWSSKPSTTRKSWHRTTSGNSGFPDEPLTVRGDTTQLHQVLANLLSNARKHTDAGTTVVTGVIALADGSAVVTVTDNGPGIPADFQRRIFSRFARADAARSGSEGTSGLGLSIVESIVQAHGGNVEVTSRPGGRSSPCGFRQSEHQA